MKIFGREPAALVATIQAALVLAVSFGLLEPIGLSTQDHVAIVVAVLSTVFGVYLAWATNETLLAPVLEAIKAVLALGAVYGLTLTTERTGALIAFATVALGLWQRGQVTPLAQPTFRFVPASSVRNVRVTVNGQEVPPQSANRPNGH